MRVDGKADILGIAAHFNGESGLGDQVASVGADDRATNEAAAFLVP